MEENEDFDVIFEGTPLYESLTHGQTLADEMSDIEKRGRTTPSSANGDRKLVSIYKTTENRVGAFQWLAGRFVPDTSNLDKVSMKTLSQMLQSSPLLLQDDANFLSSFLGSTQAEENVQAFDKRQRLHRILALSDWILLPILCAVPVGLKYCSAWLEHKPLVSTPLVLGYSACLGLRGISIYARVRQNQVFSDVTRSVNEFLKASQKFRNVYKKCLRLVQETELVARGFTLVSQKNPLSHIEQGFGSDVAIVTRQCPRLRKLLFTYSRDAVLNTRQNIKHLLERYPLDKELDVHGTFLAFEPLQSYGPCLQTVEDEDLFNLTDGFSVSALKGIYQLCSLHQSELIKVLLLVCAKYTCHDISCCSEMLGSIRQDAEDWTGSLEKCYTFYNSTWQSLEPVSRKHTPYSGQEDAFVAVHSLDLHLQAALARVRELSKRLEGSSSDSQSDSFPASCDLPSLLQPIKSELDSCKGCWEEAQLRIAKCLGKSSDAPTVKAQSDKVESNNPVTQTEGPAKEIEDYIIEDQMFEAYTDPNEVITDTHWDRPLSAEEKAKKKLERDETMRVLTELKSVISVRAVEINRREQAALQKMYPDVHKPQVCQSGFLDIEVPRIKGKNMQNRGSSLENHSAFVKQSDDSVENPKNIVENLDCVEDLEHSSRKSAHYVPKAEVVLKVEADSEMHVKDVFSEFNLKSNANVSVNDIEVKDELELYPLLNSAQNSVVTDDSNEIKSDTAGNLPKSDREKELETSDGSESVNDKHRNVKSYVTAVGIRRIRKSNMLEMCDSESDTEYARSTDYYFNESDEAEESDVLYQGRIGLPLKDLLNKGSERTEYPTDSDDDKLVSSENHKENDGNDLEFGEDKSVLDKENLVCFADNLDSPGNYMDCSSHNVECGKDNNDDIEYKEDEEDFHTNLRLPVLSFEDRLNALAGGNFGFNPDVASEMAMRSRTLGAMVEETFGGEVFGEMSEEEEETEDTEP
ncbi:vezatin-like [Dreissena polymorpha]|uniref:Vezatin n=1 Tax=Dreissena polymorpha TaxID=45954 RepID=A0A9D4IPY1_DREPO|nr:vezatin-like [Dreissena polymorpha]KAH3782330.1 hypothetical protein DPMN_160245 [Dreissena polymorpha]